MLSQPTHQLTSVVFGQLSSALKTQFFMALIFLSFTLSSQTLYVPNYSSGGIQDSNNGNVGIGTSSPSQKLEVNGAGLFYDGSIVDISLTTPGGKNGIVLNTSELGNYSRFNLANYDNATTGNRFFELRFNDDSRGLVIRKGGNIGIGTSSPTSKLQVMGDIAIDYGNSLKVDTDWNGNGGDKILNTGYDAGRGGDFLDLYVPGNGEHHKNIKFTIVEQGNVGIGIINPTSKLDVDGKVRAEEIKVEVVNPPDYVFADNYSLNGLSDVEQYIRNNKHLPDVPSAGEMLDEGIDLGEMNMRLLKKIEEITLYLIEEHKQNEVLQKKVRFLEEQVEGLQAK